MIDKEFLREAFDYLQDGALVWRKRPISHFPSAKKAEWWNRNYAGNVAGNVNNGGYRVIQILGKGHLAHRLVWQYHNGPIEDFPSIEIDHINGDRLDNRIENLRIVTKTENNRNAALRRDNQTGVPGVWFSKRYDSYRAMIRVDGKQVHLGSFKTLAEAVAARAAGEKILGFHENHGRRPPQRRRELECLTQARDAYQLKAKREAS